MQSADNISEIKTVPYGCGITSLTTQPIDAPLFWDTLKIHCETNETAFILLFFSRETFTGGDIIKQMKHAAPAVVYSACSTAGELTPAGLSDGQMMALLFDSKHFNVSAKMLSPISTTPIDEIVAEVNACKKAFVEAHPIDETNKAFALCLIDGLSFAEEAITAAFHWGLDDIPLLGGSTGDNLEFANTSLIFNGEEKPDAAVIIMVHTDVAFEVFKSDNFIPTENKLVVTSSEPDLRIVREFNAAPAAEEYAKAIGIDPLSLSPESFASHPLVIRVGGEYYCRSIQKLNDDGSLTFFCAVDDGIVLRIAQPTGMIDSTNAVLEQLRENLGGIDMVLGFDCVLRKLDARNRQVTQKISDVYKKNNVVGFNTYGEQHRSMHLNQTLTGVAFSARKPIINAAE